MTKPTGANSNMRSGSMPIRLMTPLTATFVEVPISVQVPPRMEAKASGMSRRDGEKRSRRASPMTGPTNTAVMVVLFMKADRNATAPIKTADSRMGCPPSRRASTPHMASRTPDSRKAAPMMKMAASMMMTRSPKPAKARSTGRILVSTSRQSNDSATRSTEIFSVA